MPESLSHQHPPLPEAFLEAVNRDVSVASTIDVDLERRIRALARSHVVMNYPWHTGHVFWRGRPLPASGAKFHELKNLLWPPGTVASLQRASLKGEAMLYVGDHTPTVMAEIGSAVPSPMQFLGLEIRPGEMMHFAPVGELSQMAAKGQSIITSLQDGVKAMRGILKACPPDEAKRIVLADRILFTIFEQPSFHDAAAIAANEIRLKLPHLDGILYRSVKKAGGLNIALRPESVISKCNVVSGFVAQACTLQDHPYCKLEDIEPITSISDAGVFEWGGCVGGTQLNGLNPALPVSKFPYEPF